MVGSAASLGGGGSTASLPASARGSSTRLGGSPRRRQAIGMPEGVPKGLMTYLFKGDHKHRLATDLQEDVFMASDDALDKLATERLLEGRSTPSSCDSPPRTPQDSSKAVGVPALPKIPNTENADTAAKNKPHLAGRRQLSARMGVVAPETSSASTRQAALRKSFRNELSVIKSAMLTLHTMKTSGEGFPDTKLTNPDILSLLEKYDRSNVGTCPLVPRRLMGEVEPVIDELDHDKGSMPEVLYCTATLNFYRWLCGLAPVRLNYNKWKVCDMISQCLLRRTVSPQLGRGPHEFAEAVASFIEAKSDRLSVLHHEASMVSAIEQSLAATHMLCAATQNVVRAQAGGAQALANRVQAEGLLNDRSQQRVSTRNDSEGKKIFSVDELPPCLVPYQVFWDLQPEVRKKNDSGGGGNAGGRKATLSANALNSPRQWDMTKPNRLSPRRPREIPAHLVGTNPGEASCTVSNIWGDKHGTLSFRRCILNPALKEFGASRRHDTCVLWTSVEQSHEEVKTEAAEENERSADESYSRPEAVCYPPAGYVPISLLEGGRTAWTIMPDSTLFQPTPSMCISIWQVKIEKNGTQSRDWTAERTKEVQVKGFAVDCSVRGEPFCVIFWPDVGQCWTDQQIEVEISGLCGPKDTLTFFYEIRSFHQEVLDSSLINEAARVRTLLGDASLWDQSKSAAGGQDEHPSSRHQTGISRAKTKRVTNREDRDSPTTPQVSYSSKEKHTKDVVLKTVSHHKLNIMTNSVDVNVVLRSAQAAAVVAELHLMRFGSEEEEVPFATQVQKLGFEYFLVRIKLPMARCRYELRLKASPVEEPNQMQKQQLKYMITTGEQCQTLLSSLEDPLLRKFGFAHLSPASQVHGTLVLAPSTKRIVVGQCYFLVYVDPKLAKAAASAISVAARRAVSETKGHSQANAWSPQTPLSAADDHDDMNPRHITTLFSQRLLCRDPFNPDLFKSELSTRRRAGVPRAAATTGEDLQISNQAQLSAGTGLGHLYQRLSSALEKNTQDSHGSIHLALVLHNGECVLRLRERYDIPGLYEALVNFTDSSASTSVKLIMHFPQEHVIEYSPQLLAEWLVCRTEHFPINF